jgi:hypothetical protein
MYICICMYIYTYIFIYTYIYIYIYIFINIYVYLKKKKEEERYLCIYSYINIYICVHTKIHVSVYMCLYVYYVYIYMYTCTYGNTFMYTYRVSNINYDSSLDVVLVSLFTWMSNDDLRSQSGARRATVVSTGWYGGCNFEVTLNSGEGHSDGGGNSSTYNDDNGSSSKNNYHDNESNSNPMHTRDKVTISFVNLLATASEEAETDMRGDNSNPNRIPGPRGDISTTLSG